MHENSQDKLNITMSAADAVFSAAGLSSGQEIGRVQFDTMTFYEGTIVFDPGETTASSVR